MPGLEPYLSLTPAGLLGLFVLAMLFGYLVPLRIVRGRLADKDELIHELRAALTAERQNSAQLRRGNGAAVQVLEATAEVVSEPAQASQDVV